MLDLTAKTARAILPCIVTLFTLAFGLPAHAADKNSTLQLLVVPQFPVTEIHSTWSQLLEGLKKRDFHPSSLFSAKTLTNSKRSSKLGGPTSSTATLITW